MLICAHDSARRPDARVVPLCEEVYFMLTTTSRPNGTPLLDDDRWQAVLARDRDRDGEFVFAVRSTGIYCRPSCPARRPRPENVRFFDDPHAAERAGYRACRRCRPRTTATAQDELVTRATAWLDSHAHEKVTLSRAASELGVSPGHLQRTFSRITGMSPRAYVATKRMETAKSELRTGAGVTHALHAAGYGSSSRFYDQARSRLGMNPATYRQGGAGVAIGFTTGDSPVGRVLIATTERGICAVRIGDGDAALEAGLTDEYPNSTIQRDDEALRGALEAVLIHLQHRRPLATLPLDVAGTPFQQEVWQAIRTIPIGERRSYGRIAACLGRPGAARAVARPVGQTRRPW